MEDDKGPIYHAPGRAGRALVFVDLRTVLHPAEIHVLCLACFFLNNIAPMILGSTPTRGLFVVYLGGGTVVYACPSKAGVKL